LQNLIGNAIRYTPDGGQIEVTLQEAGEYLSIRVRDSGIGIKREDLPHVFDRFYRADTARDRAVSGAGLGLAIAQAIVQAHGGRIEADSGGLNQGSVFTILLPKSEARLFASDGS
jgi:signal transduction histidine kinase